MQMNKRGNLVIIIKSIIIILVIIALIAILISKTKKDNQESINNEQQAGQNQNSLPETNITTQQQNTDDENLTSNPPIAIPTQQGIDLSPLFYSTIIDWLSQTTATLTIEITIQNLGSSNSPQTTLSVTLNNLQPQTIQIPEIQAGTTHYESIVFTNIPAGSYAGSATIDPQNTMQEADETNNELQIAINM